MFFHTKGVPLASAPTLTPSCVPSSLPREKSSNNPSLIPSPFPTVSTQRPISSFSWDIELDKPGYFEIPSIIDGIQEFFTTYNISDRDYDIEIFKDDCSTPSSGLDLTTTIDSRSYGKNHLKVSFLYNQTVVQSSNIWTANSAGGDVDVCVKLSLFSNSSSGGMLISFIETIYKIKVDLTTGFSTTVDLIRTAAHDGGIERIVTNENITVYQCDDNFDELTFPSSLTQGDSVQICVEAEEDSVFDVDKIKDVTISQNGTKAFDYVTSFVDYFWAKSSCIAVNSTASNCKVKMQLLGEYFSDIDLNDLTVTGFVKMDYLGRRRLGGVGDVNSMNEMSRSLLDKENETGSNGAKFSMDISLTPRSTNEESHISSSASVYGSIMSVLMIVAAIMIDV